MSFQFINTNIKDLIIIKNHQFEDDRGLYQKNYEYNIFLEHGIDFKITESSDLYTNKGAIRGLHYQEPESQAKLVRVIHGRVFDVVVDLRKNSKTFMEVFTIELDDSKGLSLFIPEGFAHGFLALENDTIFAYHCSGKYISKQCGGLRWNDPKLNIPWPIKENGIKKLLVTDKDKSWKLL